jgi:hypothetical protein
MKRLRNTRGWTYDSLILYREDFEELQRIFNPSGSAGVVTISDSGAVYDSLDEMKAEKGPRLGHMVIRSSKPSIVIDLRAQPKSLHLYTAEATDEADAAFFKAHEFLYPKRRPLNKFVGSLFPFVLIAFFAVLVVSGLAKTIEKVPWLWLVYPGFLVVASLCVSYLDKRTALLMSLAKRHESLSFGQRKKDELIMLVIGTVLGLVISLIVGHFRH